MQLLQQLARQPSDGDDDDDDAFPVTVALNGLDAHPSSSVSAVTSLHRRAHISDASDRNCHGRLRVFHICLMHVLNFTNM